MNDKNMKEHLRWLEQSKYDFDFYTENPNEDFEKQIYPLRELGALELIEGRTEIIKEMRVWGAVCTCAHARVQLLIAHARMLVCRW